MLNVGLVGFGFAGKTFHAPVIRVVEGLRLTTIVQRHGGGVPDPRYADVEFVRSVDELLSRAIDLVVIATPDREAVPPGRTPRRDRQAIHDHRAGSRRARPTPGRAAPGTVDLPEPPVRGRLRDAASTAVAGCPRPGDDVRISLRSLPSRAAAGRMA